MTTEKIKRMLDACYQAKRIRELLPALPNGVAPSYIHYLDVILALEKKEVQVKISDISDKLNLPRPGVTRTVKEMEEKYLSDLKKVCRFSQISHLQLPWHLMSVHLRRLTENICSVQLTEQQDGLCEAEMKLTD